MPVDTLQLRKPRTDDHQLWDVVMAIWGYPAVLAAHKLKLFDVLAAKPLLLDEVCARLKIAERPAQALLAICTSLGFVTLTEGAYALTAVSEDYLLPSNTTYFGWLFDVCTSIFPGWLRNLQGAIETDRPQGVFGNRSGTFAAWHADLAAVFTRAMHSASIGAALTWPTKIDLSIHRTMLDIGGGSGAHSLGAVSSWRDLRAVVLDRESVCEIAREYATKYGLADRVRVQSSDFFTDPFPAADLHFYGMIFHDWRPGQCDFLVRKSFASLPPGGRVIVHEVLFNEERTGPFAAAAFNVDMLVTMHGQQYSGEEVARILKGGGFTDVEVKPTFGYWSIITGRKPN